jgi:hypothetical protein
VFAGRSLLSKPRIAIGGHPDPEARKRRRGKRFPPPTSRICQQARLRRCEACDAPVPGDDLKLFDVVARVKPDPESFVAAEPCGGDLDNEASPRSSGANPVEEFLKFLGKNCNPGLKQYRTPSGSFDAHRIIGRCPAAKSTVASQRGARIQGLLPTPQRKSLPNRPLPTTPQAQQTTNLPINEITHSTFDGAGFL